MAAGKTAREYVGSGMAQAGPYAKSSAAKLAQTALESQPPTKLSEKGWGTGSINKDPAIIKPQQQPSGSSGGGAGVAGISTSFSRPVIKTLKSETMQVQPSTVSPESVAEMEGYRAAREKEIAGELKEKSQIYKDYEIASNVWKQEYENYAQRWGDRADAFYKDFKTVSAELDSARQELKDTKTDPYRVLNRMSGFGKVMLLIGSMIDGFAAGYNKTKPTLAPAIQKAIDRDIELQREDFRNKLKQAELTATERDKIWNIFTFATDQQRVAANKVAQIKLSQMAEKSKFINSKSLLADSILKLRADQKAYEAAAQPKITFQTGEREALGTVSGGRSVKFAVPKGGAREPSKDVKKQILSSAQLANETQSFSNAVKARGLYKGDKSWFMRESWWKAKWKGSKMEDVKNWGQIQGHRQARAVEGGRITDEDAKREARSFPSPDDGGEVAMMKMARRIDTNIANMAEIINQLRTYGKDDRGAVRVYNKWVGVRDHFRKTVGLTSNKPQKKVGK